MKLPEDVRELLADRIDSVEKLEMVVALRDASGHTMSVDRLCRALQLSRETVRQAVIELRATAAVALTPRGEVRLLPLPSGDLADAAIELARLHVGDRDVLVRALDEIAVGRIRRHPAAPDPAAARHGSQRDDRGK
jgi:DNA-binding FadR family transcriptional regulator